MSYSIYLQRFIDGESAALDQGLLREVLHPHVVVGEGASLFIRADDGSEADVFAHPDGVTIDRPQSGQVFDLVAALMQQLEAVLVLPGGVTLLRTEQDRADLPEGLRDSAVVVEMTGAAIERAIRAS